jgi:hypothetical protein
LADCEEQIERREKAAQQQGQHDEDRATDQRRDEKEVVVDQVVETAN